MGAAVALVDFGELEDHAHHPGVDFAVQAAVAEDRVGLLGAATVQAAVGLALLAPDRAARLEADLRRRQAPHGRTAHLHEI